MSVNRENVVWQSKNKLWNLGFYAFEPVNEDDSDYDSEWDVEYNFDEFWTVFVGYPTPEAAKAAWNGPSSGATTLVPYSKDSAEMFDQMAQFCLHPEMKEAAQKKEEARLKREHKKKLKEDFAKNDNFRRDSVVVTIKQDNKPWTELGMSNVCTGYMIPDGDWLTVEGMKVINTATGRMNPKLHKIVVQSYPRW